MEASAGPTAGSPWTMNNAALPAYPAQFTPQLPFLRHDTGGHKASAGDRQEAPAAQGPPPAEADVPPGQAGPLALYPVFSLVDPGHRWQRIHTWAVNDSQAAAAAAGSSIQDTGAPSTAVSGYHQDTFSYNASLLDVERHRASSTHDAPSHVHHLPRSMLQHTTTTTQESHHTQAAPTAPRQVQTASSGQPHGSSTPLGIHASVEKLLSVLDDLPHTQELGTAHHVNESSQATSHYKPTQQQQQQQQQRSGGSRAGGAEPSSVASATASLPHHPQRQQRPSADQVALDQARLRITSLETSLASERALAARLQAQLATELARSSAAAEAEAQARQAAATATKAVQEEKRRAQEASRQAAAAAETAAAQQADLHKQVADLQALLQEEKASHARLQRKMSAATRSITSLESDLARSEAGRAEQASHLEAASSQVSSMRSELRSLRTRLAARDQQLQAQMQEVEDTQIASLHKQLEASQDQAASQRGLLAAIAAPLLSLAQCLAPQPLAAALHLNGRPTHAFSSSPEQHAALMARLSAAVDSGDEGLVREQIHPSDVTSLSLRVRELLSAVQQVALHAERAEVARVSETDALVTHLEEQLAGAQAAHAADTKEWAAREAGLRTALRSTTSRVEELMSECEGLRSELATLRLAHEAASSVMNQQARHETVQLSSRCSALEQELMQWRQRATHAEGQAHDLTEHLEQLKAVADTKESRLVELRQALVHAQEAAASAQASAAAHQTSASLESQHLYQRVAQAEAAAAEAKSNQERLTSQLSEHQVQHAERVEQLQHQLQSARHDCDESSAAVQQARARLSALNKAIVSCCQQLLRSDARVKLQHPVTQVWMAPVSTSLDQLQAACIHGPDTLDDTTDQHNVLTCLVTATSACQAACVEAAAAVEPLHTARAQLADAITHLTAAAALCASSEGSHVSSQNGSPSQHVQTGSSSSPAQLAGQVAADASQVLAAAHQLEQAAVQQSQQLCREQNEKEVLLQQVLSLQQSLTSSLQASDAELQAQSHKSTEALQQLQLALSKEQATCKRAVHKLAVARKDVTALQAVLVALRHQQLAAEQRAEQAEHRSVQAAAQLTAAQARLAAGAHLVQQVQAKAAKSKQTLQIMVIRCRIARKRLSASLRLVHSLKVRAHKSEGQCAEQAQSLQAATSLLGKEQARAQAAFQQVQELTAKQQRSESLVHRLEERRMALESDKRSLTDKLSAATSKVTAAEQAAEAARRSEAGARQDADRTSRAAAARLAASEARAATLLEALEGAERALRESQANATRLLQEAQSVCTPLTGQHGSPFSHSAASALEGDMTPTKTAARSAAGQLVLAHSMRGEALNGTSAAGLDARAHGSSRGDSRGLAPVGSMDAAMSAKEARIAQLREGLAASQAECALLRDKVAVLQSGPAGVAGTSWAQTLQHKADEAAAAMRAAQAQLKQAQAVQDRVQEEAARAKMDILQLLSASGYVSHLMVCSDLQTWAHVTAALRAVLDRLQEQSKVCEAQVEHSVQSKQQVEEQLSACRSALEDVQGERDAALQACGRSEAVAADLSSQLQAAMTRNQDLSKQLQAAMEGNQELSGRVADLCQQMQARQQRQQQQQEAQPSVSSQVTQCNAGGAANAPARHKSRQACAQEPAESGCSYSVGWTRDDEAMSGGVSAQVSQAGSGLLQITVVQLQSEVDQLREELRLVAGEARAAQDALQEADVRCEQLASQVEEANIRLVSSAQEVVQLTHQLTASRDQAGASMKALQDQVHESRQDLSEAQDQALRALDSQAEAEQQLASVESALHAAHQQLSASQTRQQAQVAEIEALHLMVQQLQEAVITTQVDCQAQLTTVSKVSKDEAHDMLEQVMHLRQQLVKVQSSKKQEQVDAAAETAGLKQHLAELQAHHDMAEKKVLHAESAASEQLQELAARAQQIHQLQDELQANKALLLEQLQLQEQQHHLHVQQLKSSVTALKEALMHEQRERQQQQRRLKKLQAALDQAECELSAQRLDDCASHLEQLASMAAAEHQAAGLAADAAKPSHEALVMELQYQLQAVQAELSAQQSKVEVLAQREAAYMQEASWASQELQQCTLQLEEARLQNLHLSKDLAGALELLSSRLVHEEDDAASSLSDVTATTAPTIRLHQQPHDAAQLLSDNKALLTRMQRMHNKLKLARARVQELESALAVQAATAKGGDDVPVNRDQQGVQDDGLKGTDVTAKHMQAVTGLYQVALASAQEQAVVAMAQCAAAQQQADQLERRLAEEAGHQKRQAHRLTALLQAVRDQGPGLSELRQREDEWDGETRAILHLLHNQQTEIQGLQGALEAAQQQRAQEVARAEQLCEDLGLAHRQVREYQSLAASLQHQLQEAQASRAAAQLMQYEATSSSLSQGVDADAPAPDDTASIITLDLVQHASDVWRSTHAAQQNTIQQLQASVRVLQADLEYQQHLLEDMQDQAERQMQRAEAAEAAHDELQASARIEHATAQQQILELSNQVRSLGDQLEERGRQVAGLQQECQALQQAAAQATSTSHLTQQLQHQLQTVSAAHSELQEDMSKVAFELVDALQASQQLLGPWFDTLHIPASPDSLPASDLQQLVKDLARAMQERAAELVDMRDSLEAATALLEQRSQEVAQVHQALRCAESQSQASAAQVQSLQGTLVAAQHKLQRKEAEMRHVESEIAQQLADYDRLKGRLMQQEADTSRLNTEQESLARKCDDLHAALAAKQADCAAALARCAAQQEQLATTRSLLNAAQEKVRALEARCELKEVSGSRAEQHLVKEVQAAQRNIEHLQRQLDTKTAEVRECHQMLKAWEAMRLGKDAQIAALMERCKRHEEDACEKARTVEALRKRVSVVGRADSVQSTIST